MSWEQPEVSRVWQAIRLYLEIAYDGPPPAAVQARLDTLRVTPVESLHRSEVFEREPEVGEPKRYLLRLGNRHYPHMKLVIDRSPDGKGFLFRADTHDRHVCPPPGARDHVEFRELMRQNQGLAERIEAAWAQENLPTFKTFLRKSLRVRQGV